jgi:hypothetical protein
MYLTGHAVHGKSACCHVRLSETAAGGATGLGRSAALRRRRLARRAWASFASRSLGTGLSELSMAPTGAAIGAAGQVGQACFWGFTRSPTLAIARPRLFRRCSSVVERILGKAEVGSSILPNGTIGPRPYKGSGADHFPAPGVSDQISPRRSETTWGSCMAR